MPIESLKRSLFTGTGASLVLFALFAAPAGAQPRATTAVLDLATAQRIAEERSPLVRRAAAERRTVEARDVGARQVLPSNPFVSASAGPRRESTAGTPTLEGTQIGLRVEQFVEVAGQRGTRREVVRREVALATTREAIARLETRARVQAAFVVAVLSGKLVEAAARRAELGTRLAESVATRLEKGAASEIDLRLAETERGQATQERIVAELVADANRLALREAMGLDLREPLELPLELDLPPDVGRGLDAHIADALAQRAELTAIDQGRSTLDAELVRLSREAIPNPLLFVEAQRDLPGQLYVGGGIGIGLPLFRRNQGEKAIVRAERERLAVERDVVEREVSLEVARAHRAVQSLRAQLDVAIKQVLPAAEASVELLSDGWKAGKFDFFRVISASREAAGARRLYLSTLGELWQAHIALGRAIGRI